MSSEAGSSQQRPQNLRQQTLNQASGSQSSTFTNPNDPLKEFNRMSFSMNTKNVIGGPGKVDPDLLCSLCGNILFEPWQCKECNSRFHQVCLNKFAKETGQCPMACAKPKFINIKKELEPKLEHMRFICPNKDLGCRQSLSYSNVREHDAVCQYKPVKCSAFSECKTKCIRKDIAKHEAVCPNVHVPCIYCHKSVERMNILYHEQEECSGTYTCQKCSMTIVKEETKKNSHNCFKPRSKFN